MSTKKTDTASKYCKLIMVEVDGKTTKQSNKFYTMSYDGVSSNFNVEYGRVESTSKKITKPISEWDKIYREKVKKGYKDVTAFVSVKVTDAGDDDGALEKIADMKVEQFMDLMQKYTKNLVSKTYSVKAVNVTQAQIDEAQSCLNKLSALKETAAGYEKAANDTLIQLYTVIPRKMKNVKDHLLPSIALKNILTQEQDNLDAMAAQVSLSSEPKDEKTKEKVKKTKTLLDVLGITMKHVDKTVYWDDIGYLLDQKHGRRVEAIFQVDKAVENNNFNRWVGGKSNKTTKILIHGTKCTSVVPILEQGLKIRPAGNFQFSGKVYGNGNYFSEVMQKSLGYTGYDDDKVMLVYEVHTGNPFVYDGWYKGNSFELTLKNLESRGFDSTYVKAGGGLLNSEIIAYSETQNRLKYIIWLK